MPPFRRDLAALASEDCSINSGYVHAAAPVGERRSSAWEAVDRNLAAALGDASLADSDEPLA
jgi:hypothetical protein